MKPISLFLFAFFPSILACSSLKHSDEPKNPLYNNFKIIAKPVVIFGKDELRSQECYIGRVSDFLIDEHANIYVCDAVETKIKKFSPDGNFIQNIGWGEGKGPGQFLDPRRIYFDREGNIAVLDYSLKRILWFDTEGNFIDQLQLNTIGEPAEFFLYDDKIFLTGFGLYKTAPVQVVDRNSGLLLNSFGDRSKDSVLVSYVGNSILLLHNQKNNSVFMAAYYPYKIYEYSLDTFELLNIFSRAAPFLRPPIQRKSPRTGHNMIWPQGGIRNMALLFDRYLFVKIEEYPSWPKMKKGAKIIQHIDIFDQDGSWLLSFSPETAFGYKKIRSFKFDIKGNIYLAVDEPYPHVAKFTFSLLTETGLPILAAELSGIQ